MLLWKYKEVIACITGATSHENHHLLVSTFLDMSLLIKYLVEDAAFKEQLGKSIKKET